MMVQWKEDRSERGQPGEDLGGGLGGIGADSEGGGGGTVISVPELV